MLRAGPMLLVLALTLTACGPDDGDRSRRAPQNGVADKRPAQILEDADKALRSTKSVHVTGAMLVERELMTVDVHLAPGPSATGSVTRGQASVQLVRLGERLWLRGEDFWERALGRKAAAGIGGQWVLVPPTMLAAAGGIDGLTSLDGLSEEVLASRKRVRKLSHEDVRGAPVIGLDDGAGALLLVATTGRPYPLRVAPIGSRTRQRPGEQLDFTEYDRPVPIEAPGDVINDLAARLGRRS